MNDLITIHEASHQLEDALDYGRWMRELPFMEIPAGFKIKVVPPWHGAVVRFWIQKADAVDMEKCISVYFDSRNVLGSMDQPYYEAYSIDDECQRYFVGEEDKMMADIVRELNRGPN